MSTQQSPKADASGPVVGDGIASERGNWTFGGEVAKTFVSHVERSVPMYHEGHDLVCDISDYFCIPNSVCYELGTSTGQLLRKLARHNAHKTNNRFIGVDNQQSMIDEAGRHCQDLANVELLCDDILLSDFEKADFIVSYYSIQFVPPRHRQELIDKIYQSLNWGGAFVWFEKVRGPDARFQDMSASLYNRFKLSQGFSPEEILNKSESLKGVMEPFSSQGNLGLLQRAGFADVMPVFKYICFEGVIAIK